ncbi:putative membrane transporter protein [Rubrivivax sp. A210]|uniref:sulfite exporter TauE/SafE family protein n=1 Tax=Rubrivivax sp. A210 TaxID=2772301 RepID=UPI00191AD75A|nr:sulfite exporter TauE/SafE family protein [Rubrivivax sp. A210]CAD5374121.1 putative membrane transporter protein [Rubrivivax sp. A210]
MSAEILLLAAGAIAAGFVQGISGFAFSMVAMSFWVWGIEPRVAAVMAVFGSLCGQLLAAFTVRRGLSLSTLAPFLAGGLVGVPIGVALLPHLNPALFKLVLGLVLVVCCPAMLMAERIPRITAGGRGADGLVGLVGGAMGGIGGFTGVVPSLWCTLRGYDKDLQRSVIQNFNLAALAVTMAGYVLSGAVTADMLPHFAIVLPALVVPSLLGARVYRGLSPLAFRRVVLALLSCAGLAMMAGSLPWLTGLLQ